MGGARAPATHPRGIGSRVGSRDRLPLVDWLEARVDAPRCHGRLFEPRDCCTRAPSSRRSRARVTSGRVARSAGHPRAERGALRGTAGEPRESRADHDHSSRQGTRVRSVFIPGLDRELNRGAEPLLRWFDLPRHEGASDLIMAPVPSIGDEEGGQLGAYLKRLAAVRAAHERARLLYVAVTRARKTLHLSAAPVAKADGSIAPRSGTLLACLWPALAGQFKSAARKAPRRALTVACKCFTGYLPSGTPRLCPRRPSGRVCRSFSSRWVRWNSAGPEKRCATSARSFTLHSSSSPRGQHCPRRRRFKRRARYTRQQLQRLGVPEGELEGATEVVMEALSRTLADERGRWLFAPEASRRAQRACGHRPRRGPADPCGHRPLLRRCARHPLGDRFQDEPPRGRGSRGFLDREVDRYRAQLQGYVALAARSARSPCVPGSTFHCWARSAKSPERALERARDREGPAALGIRRAEPTELSQQLRRRVGARCDPTFEHKAGLAREVQLAFKIEWTLRAAQIANRFAAAAGRKTTT